MLPPLVRGGGGVGVEVEGLGSRPTRSMCDLPKKINKSMVFWLVIQSGF